MVGREGEVVKLVTAAKESTWVYPVLYLWGMVQTSFPFE